MNPESALQQSYSSELIQVVVSIKGTEIIIDPWDNCPYEVAREEGRPCNGCEFWGNEVQGIEWTEFTSCQFRSAQG